MRFELKYSVLAVIVVLSYLSKTMKESSMEHQAGLKKLRPIVMTHTPTVDIYASGKH